MVRVYFVIFGFVRRIVWFLVFLDKLKIDLGVRSGGRERLVGY